MSKLETALKYAENEQKQFIKELFEFLRFRSISTKKEFQSELRSCAQWLKNHLSSIGFSNVKLIETSNHPIVFAERIINQNLPTILFYGHYDVEPIVTKDQWSFNNGDPFEPVIVNNQVYARGAMDNKGQLFAILKAIECVFSQEEDLLCNIKLAIEGEEEIGSIGFRKLLKENNELFNTDVVLICDTNMVDSNKPTITVGLRGLLACELFVEVCGKNLHSGDFGGVVENPLVLIAQIISSIKEGGINKCPILLT